MNAGVRFGSMVAIVDCVFAENTAAQIGSAIRHSNVSILSLGDTSFCGHEAPQIVGDFYDLGNNVFNDECLTGDLDFDGEVNVFDLLILLGAWGSCADPGDCPADLNGDGIVNVLDLLILLSAWG